MSHHNALNSTQSPEARRAAMHLVHSRDWKSEHRTQSIARPHLVPRSNPQSRESRTFDTVILAAAALTAPGIWIGHAILRATHVL